MIFISNLEVETNLTLTKNYRYLEEQNCSKWKRLIKCIDSWKNCKVFAKPRLEFYYSKMIIAHYQWYKLGMGGKKCSYEER
jgi:hypothetical protein